MSRKHDPLPHPIQIPSPNGSLFSIGSSENTPDQNEDWLVPGYDDQYMDQRICHYMIMYKNQWCICYKMMGINKFIMENSYIVKYQDYSQYRPQTIRSIQFISISKAEMRMYRNMLVQDRNRINVVANSL
jgi:hypothetical protein